MPTERLGRRTIAALSPVEKPLTIYDSDLKGFGLRVMPSSSRNPQGTRSWIVEYRPGAGGRSVAKKRVVLGSTQTLTPEKAREAAKDMLARVRLGADPSADRSQARAAKTVAALADLYLAETNQTRKARTIVLYGGYWRNHILPNIGSAVAQNLTKGDILHLRQDLARQHRVTSNRVLTLLAHFFGWAAGEGYVPPGFNPAAGIERFKESGRERYLQPEELSRLGAAILQAETEGVEWAAADLDKPNAKHTRKRPETRLTRIDERAAAAIRLLLFTGARLREVLHLKWSYVDLSRGVIFLPDSKSGKKSIVLGTPAIAILESLRIAAIAAVKATGENRDKPISDYVFYSGNDPAKPKTDLKRPWALVTRAAELPGLRIHDLRHSFASVGAGAGLGLPIIGRLLGHSDPSTTNRYAHLDADPLRRATDSITATIASAMNGNRGVRADDGLNY